MNIAVIGAGASGIFAALQAAWGGAAVSLYEHNPIIGKKLLMTGSGRCNISNANASGEKYACGDIGWVNTLLGEFGVSHTLAMLEQVGIAVKQTWDGWYYPLSESAQAVVDILEGALRIANVDIYLSTHIAEIRRVGDGLGVVHYAKNAELVDRFERVIVAGGGKAYPSTGVRGDLLPTLQALGHRILPVRPALAPVMADMRAYRALQGVRLDCSVRLLQDEQVVGKSRGNLIFTAWGLNGPAVMDLSHLISMQPDVDFALSLNLLDFIQEQFFSLLEAKRSSQQELVRFLEAFFVPKLAAFYCQYVGLPTHTPMNSLTKPQLESLLQVLQDTRLLVRGVKGFEHCQSSTGGVPLDEVDPKTCASSVVKGLYLCGETLDVVGPCGGYNLQFAFSSGAVAGRAACA